MGRTENVERGPEDDGAPAPDEEPDDRADEGEPFGEEAPVVVDDLPDLLDADAEPELRGQLGLRRMFRAWGRWAVLAALAGIVSAVGAAIFVAGLDIMIRSVDHVRHTLPAWMIFVFPPIGGVVVGYMLWRMDRVAFVSACGTDSFIDAVHEADGKIPARVPILRIIGAWLTIGFGGSSGRECPMIYTGAGLGSTVGQTVDAIRARLPRPLANFFDLTPDDTRVLALCGAAGALGAIFSAPIGGAVFAVEVPYRRDMDFGLFWPALVSSSVGFGVGYLLMGRETLMNVPAMSGLSLGEWVLVVIIAIAGAGMGRLFEFIFNGYHEKVRHIFTESRRLPVWSQTAIGGLLAGIVMIFFPQVYGIGYEGIRGAANGTLFSNHIATVAVILFLFLAVAKILASTFTVGSRGVGGLLFPALFAGAALGAGIATAAHALMPGTFTHQSAYVLIAMSATYAAAGNVPIASLLLLCEATVNFTLAVPMLFANLLAYGLSGRASIYDVQRLRRNTSRRTLYTQVIIGVTFLAVLMYSGVHGLIL